MKEINIDTIKIRECGKDIIDLSLELNEIITTMFNRIQNIQNTTGEWIGTSASDFINNSNIDKLQYLKMQDAIYKNGKYLMDYADLMERLISEVK